MKPISVKKTILMFSMATIITAGVMGTRLLSDSRAEDSNLLSRDSIAIAVIKDQFKISNRNYNILSEEQKKEYGFSGTISASDIGPRITTISTSVDADLIGLEVYKYLPADGEAVVTVKKDNEYKLYKFLSFDSYNNNQDEDVISYLELYGINSAEDIAKIQFIGHSDKAKIEGRLDIISEITDKGTIAEFYNYYSVIKNSSDAYFDKLFNYKGSNNESKDTAPELKELPPDYVERKKVNLPVDKSKAGDIHYAEDSLSAGETKTSDTTTEDIGSDTSFDKGEKREVTGSTGTAGNALNNSLAIRIYNQKGVYLEAEYYPNIGFISRHEVNKDFASFLKNYYNRDN